MRGDQQGKMGVSSMGIETTPPRIPDGLVSRHLSLGSEATPCPSYPEYPHQAGTRPHTPEMVCLDQHDT